MKVYCHQKEKVRVEVKANKVEEVLFNALNAEK
jgi:hypothetical protein